MTRSQTLIMEELKKDESTADDAQELNRVRTQMATLHKDLQMLKVKSHSALKTRDKLISIINKGLGVFK